MGTWDVGIFDNDTSADVRGFYEDALGTDAATATGLVLERMAEDVAEPECAPDVWFGLAGVQWEYGRLEPDVLSEALAIIDDGRDLERWRLLGASEEDVEARAEALREFRDRLTGEPRPPAMPEPRRELPETPLVVGDVIAYRLPSGRWWPLVVIQVPRTLTSGAAPICLTYPRSFAELPTVQEVMPLDVAEDPDHEQWMLVSYELDRPVPTEPPPEVTLRVLLLWLVEDEPDDTADREDRVRKLGRVPITLSVVGQPWRLGWRELPAFAQEHLGLQ